MVQGWGFFSYQVFFSLFPYLVPATFGGPLYYTALFVILEDLETPLASFLERRLKIPRKNQRRIKGRPPILFGAISVGLEIFLMGYYGLWFLWWKGSGDQ